jgi:hypothetical protein
VSEVTCPYCCVPFTRQDIEFRCSGRASLDGRACPPITDMRQAVRLGVVDLLGPPFPAKGNRPRASCPTCGVETNYRLCPECHSLLPVRFGTVDSWRLAVVGPEGTGKTLLATAFVHELLNGLGERLDASVVGADDRTRSRYWMDHEQRLYGRGELFPPTRLSEDSDLVEPLVFEVTTERRRLGGRRLRRMLLSLLDLPGRELGASDARSAFQAMLAAASGIVLVLAPPGLGRARAVAAPTPTVREVVTLLSARRGRGDGPIPTPIAVVVPMADTLWPRLPDEAPLPPPAEVPPFDTRNSLQVHAVVRSLLSEWGEAEVDRLLGQACARYRYFALSTLGGRPAAGNRVPPGGIRPYRATDPFLWLLSELAVIPATKLKG